MSSALVFPLKCAVQQYAWGKVGSDSEVAKLSASNDSNFVVDNSATYAELWMGTHPKGPSTIVSPGMPDTSLAQWVQDNPTALGEKVLHKFDKQLPFLFKVLSVNTSLSIQAHPAKRHAEELHAARPDKYPDPNHKPEMAIALTPFEGFCGFRPLEEIVGFLKGVAEFQAVVGSEAAEALMTAQSSGQPDQVAQAMQKCFTALMTCDKDTVAKQLASLLDRLSKHGDVAMSDSNKELFQRLHSQFPGDVGCFVTFFLNHMRLQPGEAMFLGPNKPHAYLSGDCMECMACSDNVVRAGLTPKYIDVTTLCEMLEYVPSSPQQQIFPCQKHPTDSAVSIYNPPVPDFAVARIQIPADCAQPCTYTLEAVDSASIVLTVEGEGEGTTSSDTNHKVQFSRGSVVFVSADQSVNISCRSKGMLMFRAFCPLD
ncbi:PREDICTED: mannose-6-phosphate isomerase-like [Branchiostoma belcheri]|uniref:Mannose-6-phosphate isomerase n=1 Tax=Branchiostoma belcheri TaxID=7741 RepID=A0A6P4Y1Q4_BRABE|nr:PREDICTED: mannose-6-phosphate isomerase-like [Branchiostoma belcheri]